MPKGTIQKLKLITLRDILLEKTDSDHGLTLAQIMDELMAKGISADRKSIYSDFETLSTELNLEVNVRREGRNIKYYVEDREFELAEVKLMIDAIQASKFITPKKSASIVKKLKKNVSIYQARELDRQIYVNNQIKSMNKSIFYTVDTIYSAIKSNKKITFDYCMWNIKKQLVPKKEEKYSVSPWALIWADENYYLVGYDSANCMLKHYRVDKIKNATITDINREGKNEFDKKDMSTYSVVSFGMFGGEKRRVHIEFPNGKVGIFIDRFGQDVDIRKVNDDVSEAVVDIEVSQQFFGWIFGLGPDVTLTKPYDVVCDMKKSVQNMMEKYK